MSTITEGTQSPRATQPADCPTWCASEHADGSAYHANPGVVLDGRGFVESDHGVTVAPSYDPENDPEWLIEVTHGGAPLLLTRAGACDLAGMLLTALGVDQ